jgi:hypothetical protein
MGVIWRRRVAHRRLAYRSWQFFHSLAAARAPLSAAELAQAQQAADQAGMPAAGWSLFEAMSRADQRHSLAVLRDLQAAGQGEPALWQAALLHDCAKHRDGVALWHRVAVVIGRAAWPALIARLRRTDAPRRRAPWFGLWAHLHHPERGAALAQAAGCAPLAVWLMAHHQDDLAAADGDADAQRLLAAFQAADDDN